ncbi:ankyrin repeat domain-containing protein [Nocardioides caeni]|uniref:Ankyrin repeat domain-containing protein n=1 Tax=Nocardioides caeni TaxID=574700 RepID=A0A4S8N2Q3_9ACTN|nr:ankyrin repeat domain-containing protein [Nocardioides caeni]THV10055.1 ankyrin repeat domain-containing protein [Nocardioides caeni]
MKHSTRAVVAALPLALLVGACGGGASDPSPDAEPTTSQPASSDSGPASPAPAREVPQDTLDQRLRDAAWADDVARARRLIGQGADVNAKDDTEQSAYLVATSEGHLELLRLTLRHGAKVDDKDSWDGTGLIRAAERGHALVVGELLRAGIDEDHVNRIGYQAIHEAVWLGEDTVSYADTVRVLAAGGVELDRVSPSAGLTPLEMARSRGHDRLERILETVTADRSADPADPDRALLDAAESGDADAAAVALRAGADLEARDAHRRTPLLLAATFDRVEVARLLVALGADPDALDDRHDTPWLVTGVTGSIAMLEALLPAQPDLTVENRYGGLSPIPASERGHVDYVRRVAQTGVDLDHVNDLGWTAMLEAVILGDGGAAHQQVVRILLAAGADRSIGDADGVTPLEHAERKGHRALVRILRE